MKKYVKLIISTGVAAVLFIGIYLLYQRLSSEYRPNVLAGTGESVQTENNAVKDEPDGNTENESRTDETESSNTSDQSTKAPDFTVVDSEGNNVSLSDYLGKPVIVNFWASWCSPCKNEMPDFNDMYKEYGDTVQFMMVNMTGMRETLESAKQFIEDSGYTFPVFYDTALDAATTYGVNAIPMTCFISADGELKAYAMSMIDASVIKQGMEMIGVETE